MSLLDSKTDTYVCVLLATILLVWNWLIATRIETPYPPVVVELYAIPLTRIALLFLVALSAMWSPSIGILAALAYICLGADVIFFATPSDDRLISYT